jgi:hypothetical protein
MQLLRRTLAGYAAPRQLRRACWWSGLGCEANQISALLGAAAA